MGDLGRCLFLVVGVAACGDTAAEPTRPNVGPPAPQRRIAPPPGTPEELRAGHYRMLAAMHDIVVRTVHEHPYQGDGNARILRNQLESLPPGAPAHTRFSLSAGLGLAELWLGRERAAIAALEEALALESGSDAADRLKVRFDLAMAYLRLGETENCCAAASKDACLLPIRDEGIHTRPEGSENAIRHLEAVLKAAPPDDPMADEAAWLLNIAYMTLGRWPDDVPEPYRLPPNCFEPEEDFPRFFNVAESVGLATFSLAGGVVADDFDNDDDLDLMVSNWETKGQLRLFRNECDGTFTDVTEAAGLKGILGGLNLVQADYDNDGWLDVLLLRGAWLADRGDHPNSLLRNNGDGTFTDVTFRAGLGEEHWPTQAAAWADYDRDGRLDLYIGNEVGPGQRAAGQLFRNRGDGTFVDVAAAAGVTNDRLAKGVVWGDYDADGWMDLYVSNVNGPNRLYRNRGDGTFEDVAEKLGVDGPARSFPAWFWDYDNDGNLDLFVSAYTARLGDLLEACRGRPVTCELARLYRGDGAGGFKDMAAEANLVRPTLPMGANFGDLDGDGWLDFYLGTGSPPIRTLMPNALYRNRGGTRFVDVTTAAGVGHLQKGHAVAFADLDHDGDLDLFEQMGGAFLGDGFFDVLYENPGFGRRWLAVHLVGVASNRSAIGARIRVRIVENGRPRSVYRHVNSGGSFGANPLRQTIGLGNAERIESLEVVWPNGRREAFTGIELDGGIRIVEGEGKVVPLKLRSFRLGGRSG